MGEVSFSISAQQDNVSTKICNFSIQNVTRFCGFILFGPCCLGDLKNIILKNLGAVYCCLFPNCTYFFLMIF